jgi:hypothetical protein
LHEARLGIVRDRYDNLIVQDGYDAVLFISRKRVRPPTPFLLDVAKELINIVITGVIKHDRIVSYLRSLGHVAGVIQGVVQRIDRHFFTPFFNGFALIGKAPVRHLGMQALRQGCALERDCLKWDRRPANSLSSS